MSRDVRVSIARFNAILTPEATAALVAQTLNPDQTTRLLYAKRGADHDFVLVDKASDNKYTIKSFTHAQTGQSVVKMTFAGDPQHTGDCDARLKPLAEATNAIQTNYLFPEGVGHGVLNETDASPEDVSHNTEHGRTFIESHSTPAYYDTLRESVKKDVLDTISDTIMQRVERLGGSKFDIGDKAASLAEEVANVIDQLIERNETRLRQLKSQTQALETAKSAAPAPSSLEP